MINIKNTQRKIDIPINQVKKDIKNILKILNLQDFDIGVWFTNNRTIKYYNKTYRDKNKPTDILSFSYHNNLKEDLKNNLKNITDPEDKNLGDLIISADYLDKYCKKLKIDFYIRLKVLLVHGICHLLGYDHITDSDYKIMSKKENYILKKL